MKNPFKREPKATVPAKRIERATRSYAGASFSRLTADWVATGTSQDSETLMALRTLRYRSRQMVRDNHTAKNALRVISNNVIGQGVGLQPEVRMRRGDKLDTKTNDQIKKAWAKWCKKKNCHTAGLLSFQDIERQIMKSVPADGEILIRKRKMAFGESKIPFALEVIEADYLIDFRNARADNGNRIRMGVEIDSFGRPVAYWLYPAHPGDYQFQNFQPSKFVRVPADEIIHLFITDRPEQNRGIPWFHAAMPKMRHLAAYDDAEVIAARVAACIMGFIRTPDGEYQTTETPDAGKEGQRNMDLEPGVTKVLAQGEDYIPVLPTRPGGQYEPFMRAGIRNIGAAVGASYESLSKDYSQSNYSSSRLALLDDRDNWRVLQQWVIAGFHQEIYAEWLDAAVLSGELNLPFYYSDPDSYIDCDWRPRGWQWVDPLKEVQAYTKAVRAGFMTQGDVLSQGGGDFDDFTEARAREVKTNRDEGLIYDSDAAVVNDKGIAQPNVPPGQTSETLDNPPNDPQSAGDSDVTGSDPADITNDE